MNSESFVIALLLFVLSSCGTGKTIDQGTVEKASDRITVVSIIPESGQGETISLLLVSHYENGNLSLNGFYDRENAALDATDVVYLDTLEQLNFDALPLVWSVTLQDSVKTQENVCSIGSRKFLLKNKGDNSVFLSSLHIDYPEIKLPQPDSTGLAVQNISPSDCMMKEINGRKIRQESVFYLGIVNHSESLFDKSSGLHYYWINAQLKNGSRITLFFSADAAGKMTPLNSGNDYQAELREGKITLSKARESMEINLRATSDYSANYRFETIQIIRNQEIIGHGICYIL